MRTWADDFNTYEEACIYYGCDTPAQLRAEAEYEAQAWRQECMDLMEAGVIQPNAHFRPTDECAARIFGWSPADLAALDDEVPF